MIRYLLDGRPLQDGSAVRGIGTYLRGLLGGLESIGAAADVGLLLNRGEATPGGVLDRGLAVHPYRLRPANRHLRPFLDPLQVRRALLRQPPALYHAIEYGQPLHPGVPVVVTVHDLVPFVLPGDYPWMRRERVLALRQLRRADAVIAVSQSTARDVQRFAGVDPGLVTVIAEGVRAHVPLSGDDIRILRRRLELPDRFVLAVGTFDPRKRIDSLTEVVRRLRFAHDVGLVIAGDQGNFAGAVEASIRRAGLSGVTRMLGHVSANDLSGLYQACECLLFTSSYEGFGLPPLEAMAAGAPVVAFANSSVPEVVGDAALLIDDGDISAMTEQAARLLAGPNERRELGDKGRRRAAAFTWDATARATVGVYSAVLARR